MILASIVEKETGKATERSMVAGVYCNRLRIGMKLDADPTVIYPVTKGKPLGRRFFAPSSTPTTAITPISGPDCRKGRSQTRARRASRRCSTPAQTKALYFVADGTGGHVFADTLAEQNANVAKWYALRRQRGQM